MILSLFNKRSSIRLDTMELALVRAAVPAWTTAADSKTSPEHCLSSYE